MEFRTAGTTVSGLSPKEAAIAAGLDWKVVPMPIAVTGRERSVTAEGWKALMRSDLQEGNPQPLDIVSDKYAVFQNYELLEMMSNVAGNSSLELERVGSYGGGRCIWAVSSTPQLGKDEVAKGDIVSVKLRLTSGHGGGVALRVRPIVERLVCLNGATSRFFGKGISIPHRKQLDLRDEDAVREMVEESLEGFNLWLASSKRMATTRASSADTYLVVADLLGSSILDDAIANTLGGRKQVPGQSRSEFLTEASWDMETRGLVRPVFLDTVSTRHRNIIDDVVAATERYQIGKDILNGEITHWGLYNGITYQVNHRSGRNIDSGLDSAFHGKGAKMMENAFDLCAEMSLLKRASA